MRKGHGLLWALVVMLATMTGRAGADQGVIELQLRATPLHQALALLAAQTPFDYVLAPDVPATLPITASVHGRSLPETLAVVLDCAGLTSQAADGVHRIARPLPPPATPIVLPGLPGAVDWRSYAPARTTTRTQAGRAPAVLVLNDIQAGLLAAWMGGRRLNPVALRDPSSGETLLPTPLQRPEPAELGGYGCIGR